LLGSGSEQHTETTHERVEVEHAGAAPILLRLQLLGFSESIRAKKNCGRNHEVFERRE